MDKRMPVKADKLDGIVSTELFNRANHGKLSIEIDSNKEVTLHHKQPPGDGQSKQSINPDFPFKKVVSCPDCRKPLSGSAARGKNGQILPAYHCSRENHYFREPQAQFDARIKTSAKT